MEDRVNVEITDGVADVQLVRADKMNALDDAMFDALIAAGEQVSGDASVRCVVLSGEGRAFCAGLDMGRFADMAEALKDPSKKRTPLADRTHGVANRPQKAVWIWRECPVPVIAAVHGVAFGGGFQVSLGADIRIVHPETKLSVMEIKWGLVPDMAGPAIMRRLAREDRIRELTYTGRIFSGREAETYGFATEVSETPRERALDLAQEIAGKSPSAVQGAKRMFNSLGPMADAQVLLMESETQDAIAGRKNQVEAVMAQLEKRPPAFEDFR